MGPINFSPPLLITPPFPASPLMNGSCKSSTFTTTDNLQLFHRTGGIQHALFGSTSSPQDRVVSHFDQMFGHQLKHEIQTTMREQLIQFRKHYTMPGIALEEDVNKRVNFMKQNEIIFVHHVLKNMIGFLSELPPHSRLGLLLDVDETIGRAEIDFDFFFSVRPAFYLLAKYLEIYFPNVWLGICSMRGKEKQLVPQLRGDCEHTAYNLDKVAPYIVPDLVFGVNRRLYRRFFDVRAENSNKFFGHTLQRIHSSLEAINSGLCDAILIVDDMSVFDSFDEIYHPYKFKDFDTRKISDSDIITRAELEEYRGRVASISCGRHPDGTQALYSL